MIRTAILRNNIYIQELNIIDNKKTIENVCGFMNSKDNKEEITEYIDNRDFLVKYNVMKKVDKYSYGYEYQNKLFNICNTYEIKPKITLYNFDKYTNRYDIFNLCLNIHNFGATFNKSSYIRDTVITKINKMNINRISDKDFYLIIKDYLHKNNNKYLSNEDIYKLIVKTYIDIYKIKDCVIYNVIKKD